MASVFTPLERTRVYSAFVRKSQVGIWVWQMQDVAEASKIVTHTVLLHMWEEQHVPLSLAGSLEPWDQFWMVECSKGVIDAFSWPWDNFVWSYANFFFLLSLLSIACKVSATWKKPGFLRNHMGREGLASPWTSSCDAG